MAKIGIFKKVAALATAIAIVLCFALTAGAVVSVTTTTSYVDGAEGDILVEVTIQGEEIANKSVSYYAYTSEGSPVYIDQIEEGTEEIVFDYVTDDANLNSAVKVGYTGASAATPSQIDGNTVTWDKSEGEDPVAYIPTEATEATVTFETEATDVLSYDAEGADIVSIIPVAGESLTVVLENIDGPVTLDIQFKAQATAQVIDAAFVISNGHDDIASQVGQEGEFADTRWGRDKKLTAIAKVTGVENDYGVIVSETAEYEELDKFQAVDKTANGYFAVQLIDLDDDEYVLLDKNSYVVAAYAGEAVSETKTVDLVNLTEKN